MNCTYCFTDFESMIKMIVENGADVNHKDGSGKTALMLTSTYGECNRLPKYLFVL